MIIHRTATANQWGTRRDRLAAALGSVMVSATLALGATAVPASARTFDFNATGSLIQQPLPPLWACAFRRALAGRNVPCVTRPIMGGDAGSVRTPPISSRTAGAASR